MADRPGTEALARALGCDPYDMPTRPLSVDGVTIGGGIERRCGTHGRAMSQCRIAKAAERILADPGPLLAALAEAGVLAAHGEALIHYRYGVNTGTLRAADHAASIAAAIQRHERATHGPVAVDRIDVRTRYTRVTEWRPTDARP